MLERLGGALVFLDWSRWPLIVDTEWGGFPDESGIKT
jgi:hypothetical protein